MVGQMDNRMKSTIRCTLALLLVAVSYCSAQQSPEPKNLSAPTFRVSRMPSGALGKLYFQTCRSVEAAEEFIREHPDERDLCAGALLNIAALQARQDKKKAIGSYQKAVDEHGDEIVPGKNANFTVANWALLRIARLERDMGNRDKALEIFGQLMKSSDFNTRTISRIEYLTTKQSHLKVIAGVSVQGNGPFSVGDKIPVSVSVKNPSEEPVVFKCYVGIRYKTYGGLAREGSNEEITLAPGAKREIPMAFTEKDTNGLVPGVYKLTASLTGIPFEAISKSIEIKK